MAPQVETLAPYNTSFYDQQRGGSYDSAEVVIPHLLSLIRVRSAVDIGCGVATWLRALTEHGVSDVIGVDGDYVDRSAVQIPNDRFLALDICRPLNLDRRFDLALSLEVAEHLPLDCAEGFIESLTRLAPVILFSAAIPFQGGTNHVNEQWPEYWANIFDKHGYVPLDCIRRHVWNDTRVEWWYAQNVLVYANEEGLSMNPNLACCKEMRAERQLSLVHPRKYLLVADAPPPGLRQSIALTAAAANRALVKRLKRATKTLHPVDQPR
jgi:SAM-dependent methyltransferase